MIGDGRDAAASLRAMIVADLLRLGAVTTTVRCVNAETCGIRFDLCYLPSALPRCIACGGLTVLVKVMKEARR